jgi:hypothetical protein
MPVNHDLWKEPLAARFHENSLLGKMIIWKRDLYLKEKRPQDMAVSSASVRAPSLQITRVKEETANQEKGP